MCTEQDCLSKIYRNLRTRLRSDQQGSTNLPGTKRFGDFSLFLVIQYRVNPSQVGIQVLHLERDLVRVKKKNLLEKEKCSTDRDVVSSQRQRNETLSVPGIQFKSVFLS